MARKPSIPRALADDEPIDKPPADASDAEQLVWLLEVCRKRGYKLGPHVQIGNVIVQVTDVRLLKQEAFFDDPAPHAAVPDIWEEHGHRRDDEPPDGTTGR